VCTLPANFGDLVQLVTEPQSFMFVAPMTPAGSRGVRLTLCDGPTLSETRGRSFVAFGAAVSRQVCTLPANFGDRVQLVTEPQSFMFVAPMTPAGSRGVRLTLCDGPTLSETRGPPFVAPRAVVKFFFVWFFIVQFCFLPVMIFVFGSRYDCFQEPVWVVKGILTARGLVRGGWRTNLIARDLGEGVWVGWMLKMVLKI